MLFRVLFLAILLFTSSHAYKKLTVTVSIEPYKYLVERIGKSKVKVLSVYNNSLIIDNNSQFQMRKLAKSKAYFVTKLSFEDKNIKKLKKINPKIEVKDISFGIRELKDKEGIVNPYLWLDPLALKIIVDNIYFEMIKLDKKNKDFYLLNYNKLIDEIEQLFLRLKRLHNKSEKAGIFVYNKYWRHFASRYDLDLYHLEKKVLASNNMRKIIKISTTNSIKKVLIDRDIYYDIPNSISNFTGAKIIEHDIYEYSVLSNIFLLGQLLFTDL